MSLKCMPGSKLFTTQRFTITSRFFRGLRHWPRAMVDQSIDRKNTNAMKGSS